MIAKEPRRYVAFKSTSSIRRRFSVHTLKAGASNLLIELMKCLNQKVTITTVGCRSVTASRKVSN